MASVEAQRAEPTRGGRSRPEHVRTRRWSWHRTAMLVILAVFLFVATWVGLRAWYVKGELEQAQGLVTALRDQVAAGEYDGLTDAYAEVQGHTSTARGLADDPLWRATEHVPFLGPNLRVMRELATIVDDAMVLAEPLVSLAGAWDTALVPRDGKIPLEPFREAAADFPAVAEGFATLDEQLGSVRTAGTLGQVSAAHAQVADLVGKASSALADAAPIVSRIPEILGGDGPRTYVVMFQNNTEVRSLGGTALYFAEVVVDAGAISPPKVIPAGLGNFEWYASPVGPVESGFEDIFPGRLGTFIPNATIRPSSLGAAQVVAAEWRRTFDKDIDGVISMDSGALEALLSALDPIVLSTGDVVSSDNVVSLLFNEVYLRYNTGNDGADNLSQNAVFSETLTQTFSRVSSGQFDPVTLATSMMDAGTARRFSVWFADAGERDALARSPLGARDLPENTATEDVVGVYLNDEAGSKLNYYLATTLTTGSAVCTPDGRQARRLTLALTSTLAPEAVPGLSPSVAGTRYAMHGLAKGDQRLLIFLYLPPGADLLTASIGGESVPLDVHNDSGHPVQALWLTLPPGGTVEVSADALMAEPGERALVTEVTPTVAGTALATAPLDCGTIALP